MISFTELRAHLPFPKDMKVLSVHAALVKMVRISINNPLSQVLFKLSVCGIQPFENELMQTSVLSYPFLVYYYNNYVQGPYSVLLSMASLLRALHNQFMIDYVCLIGTMLVSSSYDETLVIWDVENCCQKFALKVKKTLFLYSQLLPCRLKIGLSLLISLVGNPAVPDTCTLHPETCIYI